MANLYLIPSLLRDTAPIDTIPPLTLAVLRKLDHLVVETPKQARRFLKSAGVVLAGRRLDMQILDEHTPDVQVANLMEPVQRGYDLGILTDAGCPGIADPGARLVRVAHAQAIRVVPLVGPSAILLALMASGLNGQQFAFHGYLPIDAHARQQAINALEIESRRRSQTQIAIEAPYRNQRLLDALLHTCAPDTLLSLATDLTLDSEYIATLSIAQWRAAVLPNIDKRPTIFLLLAAARRVASTRTRT